MARRNKGHNKKMKKGLKQVSEVVEPTTNKTKPTYESKPNPGFNPNSATPQMFSLEVEEESAPKPSSTKMVIVGYHSHCMDGLGALAAAIMGLRDQGFEVVSIPLDHGPSNKSLDKITDTIDTLVLTESFGYQVYLVDFTFNNSQMIELLSGLGHQTRLTVIDHHKGQEETYKEIKRLFPHHQLEIVYDLTKSGAVLTYEYFNPGLDVPQTLQYIQDRDLWTWKLNDSESVNAGLSFATGKTDVDLLIKTIKYERKHLPMMLFDGKTVNEELQTFSETLVQGNVKFIKAKVHPVPTLSTQQDIVVAHLFCPANYTSVTGSLLAQHYPEVDAVLMYEFGINDVKLSVRSKKELALPLAVKFGGGGHPNASGAVTSLHKLRSEIIHGRPYKLPLLARLRRLKHKVFGLK